MPPSREGGIFISLVILTFTLSKSLASITVPWKNSTCVKWRLNKPSNSKSGSFLKYKWIQCYWVELCIMNISYRVTEIWYTRCSLSNTSCLSKHYIPKFYCTFATIVLHYKIQIFLCYHDTTSNLIYTFLMLSSWVP